MRNIITAILLLASFAASSQSSGVKFTDDFAWRRYVGHLAVKNGFQPQVSCGWPGTPSSLNLSKKGFLAIDTCNNKLGFWNGIYWQEVTGSGSGSTIDTSSLSARINQKLDEVTSGVGILTMPYGGTLNGVTVSVDTAGIVASKPYVTNKFGNKLDEVTQGIGITVLPYGGSAIGATIGADTAGILAAKPWVLDRISDSVGASVFDIINVPAGLRYANHSLFTPTDSSLISLGYANGLFVPLSRTVNGYPLSSNIALVKGDVGLGSVENTALSTWAGTSNITTVGTIATGVWNATAIGDSKIASAATWNAKQAAYTNLTSFGSLANGNGWLRNNGSGTFSYTFPTASDIGLPLVENTALSTWLGSLNITTLGTIATGTWNATAIADAYIASAAAWNAKQAALVSGTNIKTINGNNILGSGDLSISGSGGISDPGANGILARTALNTTVARTITGTTNRVSVTDGDGVAGNPTIDVVSTPNATASRIMERDANANTLVNNITTNVTSVTTAAGTTTLTVSSARKQYFTGTSTQQIVLPDATTLTNGFEFELINTSTVALPVDNDGAELLEVLLQGSKTTFTLVDNSTANGVWLVSEPTLLQSAYRKMPTIIQPSGSTTVPTSMGNSLSTAATLGNNTISNANHWTSMFHKRFTTSATAGNSSNMRAGAASFFATNVSGVGGYKAEFMCGSGSINLNGSQTIFGVCASTGALAGDPSASPNQIGMGFDAADASTGNWYLMHNDASGTSTKVDLGATHAARAVDKGFYLRILVKPNSTTYWIKVVNINTGAVVYEASHNTDVPGANVLMAFQAQVRNGAVASAANLDMSLIKIQPF